LNTRFRQLRSGVAPSVERAPEFAIPYLLRNLHLSVRQVVEEELRRRGVDVSMANLTTLFMIDYKPGVPGAELARLCGVTAQTMNTILRRLETDRSIERRPVPGNLRAISWILTSKGQKLLERALIISQTVWSHVLLPLRADEIAQFQNLLERCLAGVDAELEQTVAVPKAPPVKRKAAAEKSTTVKRRKARTASAGRALA
jgi:DNA-binding MarR family transcriptional regulator